MVREVWVKWAQEQPSPKETWLLPWNKLSESEKEVDRRIGETLLKAGTLREETSLDADNIRRGWIAVDLDGTLAEYAGWRGPETIGRAIPKMLERVRFWILAGIPVKVFTARASDPRQVPYIRSWLDKYQLQEVKITHVKDFDMIELWDDRAISIQRNTGEILGGESRIRIAEVSSERD